MRGSCEMVEMNSSLLAAMTERLKAASSRFAFVQARVSAETLVRDECALAAHEMLEGRGYRVHMEKEMEGKRADLMIVPVDDNRKEDRSHACLIETKMAWPGGIGECAAYVKTDLGALAGRDNAWVLVLYFAFDESLSWLPFGRREIPFERGLIKFLDMVGPDTPIRGDIFSFAHDGVKGRACLLAWRAKKHASPPALI